MVALGSNFGLVGDDDGAVVCVPVPPEPASLSSSPHATITVAARPTARRLSAHGRTPALRLRTDITFPPRSAAPAAPILVPRTIQGTLVGCPLVVDPMVAPPMGRPGPRPGPGRRAG